MSDVSNCAACGAPVMSTLVETEGNKAPVWRACWHFDRAAVLREAVAGLTEEQWDAIDDAVTAAGNATTGGHAYDMDAAYEGFKAALLRAFGVEA